MEPAHMETVTIATNTGPWGGGTSQTSSAHLGKELLEKYSLVLGNQALKLRDQKLKLLGQKHPAR